MPPLGQIVWHTMFKPQAERIPAVVEDARAMVGASLDVVEKALDGRDYLLGAEFSAADIMMGYPLQSAKWFRVLTDAHPRVGAYFARLQARPPFQKAFAT